MKQSAKEKIAISENSTVNMEPRMTVGFILLKEFTLFAFAGFVDALRIAGDTADNSRQRRCKWTIIAPSITPIMANSGLSVIPWETFSECTADFDYLVVIGGRIEPQRKTDPLIVKYIQEFADKGGFVIGICTATFVLARAGIMKNRKCCVHWVHREEFEVEFPGFIVNSDTVFIEDKKRITCAGGHSAVDVAIHLIERHCGEQKARKAAVGMVIDKVHGRFSPQPHAEASWFGEIPSQLIRRAITIMDQSVTGKLSMTDLAKKLNVSKNTLFRTFRQTIDVKPANLFRIMRVAHGHWCLQNTQISIAEIAFIYQFSDASHFTKLHGAYYGMTPKEARENSLIECKSRVFDSNENGIIKSILEGGLFVFSNVN